MCSLDINPQNDIAEVITLWKKITGESTGNPRPLKVVMKDKIIKTIMFKKLWKLRDAEDTFRALSIQSNQTKKEREEENICWMRLRIDRRMMRETAGIG